MNILKPKKSTTSQAVSVNAKRKSLQAGIESLKPLQPAKNVASFKQVRDPQSPVDKNGKAKGPDDMDSDDETNVDDEKSNGADEEDVKTSLLSPEDAQKQGELAEGVRKIRVSIKAQSLSELP